MADYELKLLAPAWAELEAIADRHLNLVGPDSAQKITEKLLDSLENLKIGEIASQLSFHRFIALGYCPDHFLVTASSCFLADSSFAAV